MGAALDLHWIPLGAGGHVVRFNGRVFEALVAARERRRPLALYHAALTAELDGTRYAIEIAPSPDADGHARGVVATGAVGCRAAGRFRRFRYEVRCGREGAIPDLAYAAPAIRLTRDPRTVRRALALVREVPTPVWGRDELHAGEMWNSNSMVAWVLARAGLERGVRPPAGGRAPGWDAGLRVVARERLRAVPDTGSGSTHDNRVMTRLLIAYDGSPSARAALAVASALFEHAEAVVAHVHPPPPTVEAGALARAALPDAVVREGITRMREDAHEQAQRLVDEGVAAAREAGLDARPELRWAVTPWRELRDTAPEVEADVIVSGTRGVGPIDRVLVGSTASSLLHHADRPLLVVPDETTDVSGPLLAGYDDSEGARGALQFAAAHLPARPVLVAHGWRVPAVVPVGAVLGEEPWEAAAAQVAEEGAAFAREAGLDATGLAVNATIGEWRALLATAEEEGAAAILVGSRGRGAIASTVLGSVASGLVHAATRPVLVVP